ncbi:MAG: hypothetical protein J1F02_09175 [Lachnospiraceae bacterium]|nr:hypothetical protein [Lachnospiraceae bacterium]
MAEFLNHYGVVYGVALLCVLEIAVKGMLGHTYRRLIKAARDMGHSRHRLINALRMKFETCYQLKIGVPNVEVFVEKYLRHYRVFGLYIKTWETFCNQCMLLAMIGSFGGGIWAMVLDLERSVIFASLFAGVLGNGIILLFDCFFGIGNKLEILRIDMMDFLENIYKPRLENETFHTQMMKEYQQEYFTESWEEQGDSRPSEKIVSLMSRETETAPAEESEPERMLSFEFTKEEEEVIRDVIREYMG